MRISGPVRLQGLCLEADQKTANLPGGSQILNLKFRLPRYKRILNFQPMKISQWFKSKPKKPVSKTREWINAITFAVVAATLIRWTTVEAYVIPTPSMENSALVGDFLFVSKLHYGTRTTGTPLQVPLTHQKIWGTDIPSYLDWVRLPVYRFPGFAQVKNGDVVVFNVPRIGQNDGVLHPISLKNNYVKRCIGIPGDRLEIRATQVFINDAPLRNPVDMKFSYLVNSRDEIHKRNLNKLGLGSDDFYYLGRTDDGAAWYRMFLTPAQVKEVKEQPYVLSFREGYSNDDGPEGDIFPQYMNKKWNKDNYGPLTLPAKGMTISLNDSTMGMYGETILLFEHLNDARIENGKLYIDGKEATEYTFKQGYYFMMGDNRHNSLDSRYWGFVPEDHIVGKPIFVWMSIDQEASLLHKVRWRRLFTPIN
jgi:signal peptidase I